MRKGNKEPLGLPRGSVRAILTLVVAAPLPVLVVLGALGRGMDAEVMAFYTAVLMLVLRDYFGSRDGSHQVEEDESSLARDEE